VLPDWLVSSPGGLFLWAGTGVFFRGLGVGNWAYCLLIWLVLGFFYSKECFFLRISFFKFILLQNFRGKKANGFKEKFNYALRFTKKEKENK